MCFIEYLGYTCGHTSMPIKRPCPLTTQLHNNPCCPNAAVRPILAQTMCPGCARLLHGRYVNIIEHEHRFMHERGACNCDVKFPYLQQPRVVQHEEPELVPVNICECCLKGMATGAKKDNVEKPVKGAADIVASSPSGSASESSSKSAHSPTQKFSFSPSAAAFTPGQPQLQSQGQGQGHTHTQSTEIVIYEQNPTSNTTARVHHSQASASSSNKSAVVARTPDSSGGSRRTSFSSEKGKGKGKGRGGKKSRGGRAQVSASPKQHRTYNEAYPGQGQQHTRRTSSSAAAQGAPKLAPLFEERETLGKKLEVSVRMLSLYGAEWTHDHAELHRTGRCKCEIKFDKYPAQYMPLLKEARESESCCNEHCNHNAAGVTSQSHDNSNTAPTSSIPISQSDGVLRSSTMSTSRANTNPTSYENPTTSGLLPTIAQTAQAQPQPQVPAPDYTGYFYTPGQQGSATTPSSPTFRTQPGQPARWACSPYDTSSADPSSSAAETSRPVDMQTVWYDQRDTPIAGLPVGAGPEGDSHMPPFEDCELYYPKVSCDRRPASR
ncbi:hypothetical protein F5Y06DRAFT_259434 [Hypoxylon sp. FL0890]|nr:hypothetical protein F5Y06DRAFT_259434 [Hypoxylon sp. FL0890]